MNLIRRIKCWLGWHGENDWEKKQITPYAQSLNWFAREFVESYEGFNFNLPRTKWEQCKHCGRVRE